MNPVDDGDPWDEQDVPAPASNRSKVVLVTVVAVVLVITVIACCLVVRTLLPLFFLNLDPRKVP